MEGKRKKRKRRGKDGSEGSLELGVGAYLGGPFNLASEQSRGERKATSQPTKRKRGGYACFV